MTDETTNSFAPVSPDFAGGNDHEARVQQAIQKALALGEEVDRTEAPPRFSLFELMLTVTLLAIMLGLLRSLGIWGAVISFVGAVVWTQAIYPHWYRTQRARQEAMFDWVWILVMPVVCLVSDPFVFKKQPELIEAAFDLRQLAQFGPRLGQEGVLVYVVIAWQMLTVVLWILARSRLSRLAGLFFGTWLVGAVVTGVLGILLAPIAAIGSFVGVGLLGFTPLFTTYGLGRRLREAIDDGVLDAADQSVPIFWLLTAFGLMGAFLVPLCAVSWLEPWLAHGH